MKLFGKKFLLCMALSVMLVIGMSSPALAENASVTDEKASTENVGPETANETAQDNLAAGEIKTKQDTAKKSNKEKIQVQQSVKNTAKAATPKGDPVPSSSLTLKWLDTSETTKTITGNDNNTATQAVSLELTYSLGGTTDAQAGEVTLKMPYTVFADRDGKMVGTVTPPANLVTKEQYDGGSRSTGASYYYYYEDTDADGQYDNIVFKNYDSIKTSYYFVADVVYGTGSLDQIKDGYEKTNLEASAAFGATATKKTDPLTIKVDTAFPTPSASKSLLKRYQSWQDTWTQKGIEKPADANDYVYTLVDIGPAFHYNSSEPYIRAYTETPGNGGKVIAWAQSKNAGGDFDNAIKTYKDADPNSLKTVIEGQKSFFDTGDYDYVRSTTGEASGYVAIVAYPKTALTEDTEYEKFAGVDYYGYGTVTNKADVTYTPLEGDAKTDSVDVNLTFPKKDLSNYTYNGELYSITKQNATVRVTTGSAAGYNQNFDIRGALTVLLRGGTVSKGVQPYDAVLDTDIVARSHFWPNEGKTYSITAIDDYMDLAGTILEPGDYQFTTIHMGGNVTLWKKDFSGDSYNEVADTTTASPKISLHAYVNGVWQKVGDYDNAGSEDVTLPAGTTKIKATIDGLKQGASLNLRPNFEIIGSEHVKTIINGKDVKDGEALNLTNYSATKVQDETGKVLNAINGGNLTGTVATEIAAKDEAEHGVKLQRAKSTTKFTYIDVERTTETAKKVVQVGTAQNGQAPLTYRIINERSGVDESIYSTFPQDLQNIAKKSAAQSNTEFYDLLPKGVSVDPASIKVQVFTLPYDNSPDGLVDRDLPFTYETIENWRDSGRTMLIVKANGTTGDTKEGFIGSTFNTSCIGVTFTGYVDLSDLNVYGLTKTNDAEAASQEALEGKVNTTNAKDDGSAYSGAETVWTDINGDGNTTQKVNSATNTTTLGFPLAAELGFRKSVKGSEDIFYSDLGHSVGGADYSYRLRFTNGENVETTGVVMYDILETGADKYEGKAGTKYWQGSLDSIDISDAVDKGIKPVIYYSTRTGLSYDTAGDRDLTDTDIWTTTKPADMSSVTAIAVDLSKATDGTTDYKWQAKEAINVYVHMTAPSNVKDYIEPTVYAYNQGMAAVKYKLESGGTADKVEPGNIVRNQLLMPKIDIHKASNPASGTAAEPTKVKLKSKIDYDVNIKNTGNAAYTGATVEDIIPAGLTADTAKIKVYTGTDADKAVLLTEDDNIILKTEGQKLTFTVKSLSLNQEYHFVIPTTVADDDAVFENTAILTRANGVDIGKNSETTYHKSKPLLADNAALGLTKNVVGDYDKNETYTFTLTADGDNPENGVSGLKTIGNVQAADIENGIKKVGNIFGTGTFKLPGTYKFTVKETAGSSTKCVYDESEYLWTVTVTEDAGFALTAENKIEKVKDAYGNTIDPAKTTESLQFTNMYPTNPKKEVFKGDGTTSVDGKKVKAGEELTYKITYKNTTGANVIAKITDKLPANCTFVSANNNGTENNGIVTWSKSVAEGKSFTVSLKVKVKKNDGTGLENTAKVNDGTNDYDTNTVKNPVPTEKPKIPDPKEPKEPKNPESKDSIRKAPETGDSNSAQMLIMLIALFGGVALSVSAYDKKHSRKK